MAKHEADVTRVFINEILIDKLGYTTRQIVTDATFKEYTGSARPDILISELEYDNHKENNRKFIENLVAYAEVKIDSLVDDFNWKEGKRKGKEKAKKLKIPFYIITNTKTSIFYNTLTNKKIKLNNNIIKEFQTIDIFRLINTQLKNDNTLSNIVINSNSISAISEAVFNKKLWELAKIYRYITFKSKIQKIDFTVGLIALAFFEEKHELEGKKDKTKIYWSDCSIQNDTSPSKIVANLSQYITWLKQESQFSEFHKFMDGVRHSIQGDDEAPIVKCENMKKIYDVINTMKPLHGSAFDLFGAVYEIFADSKEKKEFGEYFTRRHYAHILCKLLLENEGDFDIDKQFKILDPACGTGGFLTEGFKILQNRFIKNDQNLTKAKNFLKNNCFYGWDVRPENISRAKLNMFLVGDGHTNIEIKDTLNSSHDEHKFDYVITNPPYGAGTVLSDSENISSKRTEIAFFFKILSLLKNNGKSCIILPDGILENPSFTNLRKEILEKCNIHAIISLPKFAFAPYTKEKTYAVYFSKKINNKIQRDPIWMYIIDNDGYANSDKRFPTKLRIDGGKWMHDEISGWIDTNGEEKDGILENRWLRFDDSNTIGSEWIDEKGHTVTLRKGGHVKMVDITSDSYFRLLPEFYIRKYEPKFITLDKLIIQVDNLMNEYDGVINNEIP